MITAALNTVTVARVVHRSTGDTAELARIASEIAERLDEMNEIKFGSGMDIVVRLANVARIDAGAFDMAVSVLHGNVEALLDSYAVQGERAGREKQTMHYRNLKSIEHLRVVFPEAADLFDVIRLSVKHHEDPMSKADVLRESED
jgi:hypothetical protein